MIVHQDAADPLAITGKSRSSFAVAFRFLPKENARALAHLYAFCRIADDCVDLPTTNSDKQQSLDYWRSELQKAYQGHDCHTVIQKIYTVLQPYSIPLAFLEGILDGCTLDITKARYHDMNELLDYCYHVAGLVGLSCLPIFGYTSPSANEMAIHLGHALQLTNILRDVWEDFGRGRIYIPQNLLAKHGINESVFASATETPGLVSALKEVAATAQMMFAKADKELKNDTAGKLKPARIMRDAYFRLLNKIEKNDFRVLSSPVRLSTFDKIAVLLPYLLGVR